MPKTLPQGDVTFLFTDIEGSTRLLQCLGQDFVTVLEDHRRILRDAFADFDGLELRTEGDSFFVVFQSARGALAAAVRAQADLLAHPWPSDEQVRVRMGLHTGRATVSGGDYVGLAVHKGARIAAAAHGGQVLVSDTTKAVVERELPEAVQLRDLGEHSLKDFDRPVRLFQARHADLLDDFPPLRTPGSHPNNLPVALTAFVGRDSEIADLKLALRETRLVSIVGAGGSGKTRLALEVAGEMLGVFGDGVWFVDLAGVADDALVPAAIAAAVGAREHLGIGALEAVTRELAGRTVLLVLDNCEHVARAATAAAGTLLARLPEVSILATSQVPLGVAGESVWRVEPLALPPPGAAQPLDELARFDAVRLFVERAAQRRQGFVLTEDNAPAIAQICTGLDGSPLAIELAAARVTMLHPRQIAERMDRRFGLLTGGARDAPDRQRTLRSAVEWSFDLLAASERDLLTKLSVFRGGFTLEAVERVCGADGDVFGSLSHLVDRSFVTVDFGREEPRYRLLESIRAFAAERLLESGSLEQVRDAHLAWVLDLCRAASDHVGTPEQQRAQRHVQEEQDNVREALEWACAAPRVEAAHLMLSGLWRFWVSRGSPAEGMAWARRILALGGDATATRARALNAAANIANRQGAYAEATRAVEEAHRISLQIDDPSGAASALGTIATAAYQTGDFDNAYRFYLEAIEIRRELGDPIALARVLSNAGLVLYSKGRFDEAEPLFTESLAACRTAGDKIGTIACSVNLGSLCKAVGRFPEAERLLAEAIELARSIEDRHFTIIAEGSLGLLRLEQGDFERARYYIERAVEGARAFGDPNRLAWAEFSLACVAVEEGNIEEASDLLVRSISARRDIGDRFTLAVSLEFAGRVWLARGEHEQAVLCLAAGAAQLDAIGAVMPSHAVGPNEAALAVAAAAVGAQAFEAIWKRGAALSVGEAVEVALEGLARAA